MKASGEYRNVPIRSVVFAFVLLAGSLPAPSGADGDATVVHALRGAPTTYFGWAVSELGDVDADGVDDLIVGAPNLGRFVPGPGMLLVYSGRTGRPIHLFAGSGVDQLGFSMADAGDVDADGVPDVIGGAPGGSRASVYSGRTGATIHVLSGEAVGDRFGFAVAPAGDVNDDGHADVLVGATQRGSGRVYVFSGVDGALIRILEGERNLDRFGSGTASVGDVTGDGVVDHVVGAFDAGEGRRGRAYVFSGADGSFLWAADPDADGVGLGHFFVAGPGDVDGDGVPDVYAGDFAGNAAYVFSGTDGSLIHRFAGTPGAGLGPGRGAGDVDGDGHADLVVGSFTSSEGTPEAGKVEVFSGADGSVIRTITGSIPNEQLGFDAVGIGDVNANGARDLLLSAASGDAVYVVAG